MQSIHDNPFALIESFSRDVDRLCRAGREVRARYRPTIDIHEESERYVIHTDLPGVDAAAIDITVDGDLLKIKGERTVPEPREGTEIHRAERAEGRFERHIRLPESVASEGIEAEYRNGVLTVSIPKIKAPEPYRIEVTAN